MRARTDAVIARANAMLAAAAAAPPLPSPPTPLRPPAQRPRSSLLAPDIGGRSLSFAEEVLAIPYLSERSIMSYLRQDEALELRAASRTCREAVAEHGWSDWILGRSVIKRNVAGWRNCFPLARAANLQGNETLADVDFVHLRGVNKVSLDGCNQATITDAAFAHLRGIRTLAMDGCYQISDAAMEHLGVAPT